MVTGTRFISQSANFVLGNFYRLPGFVPRNLRGDHFGRGGCTWGPPSAEFRRRYCEEPQHVSSEPNPSGIHASRPTVEHNLIVARATTEISRPSSVCHLTVDTVGVVMVSRVRRFHSYTRTAVTRPSCRSVWLSFGLRLLVAVAFAFALPVLHRSASTSISWDKVLLDTLLRSLHEMGDKKRVHELRVDEVSVQK